MTDVPTPRVEPVTAREHSALSVSDNILRLVALYGYARFDMATVTKQDYADASDAAYKSRAEIADLIAQQAARLERAREALTRIMHARGNPNSPVTNMGRSMMREIAGEALAAIDGAKT